MDGSIKLLTRFAFVAAISMTFALDGFAASPRAGWVKIEITSADGLPKPIPPGLITASGAQDVADYGSFRIVTVPGHTPGHSAYVVTGSEQLMVSADTMYVPALLAPHPDWQGSYDQDGPTAIASRRKLIDRVIADKMTICGSHFPFPGTGSFAKAGSAYAFTPATQA